MSLYLGTDKISGVATGDAAVSNTGAEVVMGEITFTTTSNFIVIYDIAGKDNVVLMYMDSCRCPASAMADSGFVNIAINGESHSYVTHYSNELYAGSNDGFIIYEKAIGRISINTGMSYNEKFISGKYMYVAW